MTLGYDEMPLVDPVRKLPRTVRSQAWIYATTNDFGLVERDPRDISIRECLDAKARLLRD